ncbi:hypothetical protein PUN28_003456 [Cardiocondyla obscurior]|uniref:Uncharacterized protein n=1 Tax=Cardiocondyla obscurior TaxID=286306 RepID=A0AAW2GJ40_9HYME
MHNAVHMRYLLSGPVSLTRCPAHFIRTLETIILKLLYVNLTSHYFFNYRAANDNDNTLFVFCLIRIFFSNAGPSIVRYIYCKSNI